MIVHVDPQVQRMDRAEHDERRRVVTREGAFPGAAFDLQDLAGDRGAHRPALDLGLYGAEASTTATAALASWRRAAMLDGMPVTAQLLGPNGQGFWTRSANRSRSRVSARVASNARLRPPEPALVERERGAEMPIIEG